MKDYIRVAVLLGAICMHFMWQYGKLITNQLEFSSIEKKFNLEIGAEVLLNVFSNDTPLSEKIGKLVKKIDNGSWKIEHLQTKTFMNVTNENFTLLNTELIDPSKVTIVMADSRGIDLIHDTYYPTYATISNYVYAKHFGYDFIYYQYYNDTCKHKIYGEINSPWCKLLVIYEVLKKNKTVVWIDTDAHFHNLNYSLYFVANNQNRDPRNYNGIWFNNDWPSNSYAPSTNFFILSPNSLSQCFLKDWWNANYSYYNKRDWYEQTGLTDFLLKKYDGFYKKKLTIIRPFPHSFYEHVSHYHHRKRKWAFRGHVRDTLNLNDEQIQEYIDEIKNNSFIKISKKVIQQLENAIYWTPNEKKLCSAMLSEDAFRIH